MWFFIILLAVILITQALVMDYIQCQKKGWTPIVISVRDWFLKLTGKNDE